MGVNELMSKAARSSLGDSANKLFLFINTSYTNKQLWELVLKCKPTEVYRRRACACNLGGSATAAAGQRLESSLHWDFNLLNQIFGLDSPCLANFCLSAAL